MEIKICTLLFLGFNSWKDIRYRQISLGTAAVAAMIGLGNMLWKDKFQIWVLVAAGFGIGMLAISIATDGALGFGDCWVVVVLGFLLEPGEFCFTVCLGLMSAAVWAGILMTVFKKSRKTEFPLVPFFLLGYLGGLCL